MGQLGLRMAIFLSDMLKFLLYLHIMLDTFFKPFSCSIYIPASWVPPWGCSLKGNPFSILQDQEGWDTRCNWCLFDCMYVHLLIFSLQKKVMWSHKSLVLSWTVEKLTSAIVVKVNYLWVRPNFVMACYRYDPCLWTNLNELLVLWNQSFPSVWLQSMVLCCQEPKILVYLLG